MKSTGGLLAVALIGLAFFAFKDKLGGMLPGNSAAEANSSAAAAAATTRDLTGYVEKYLGNPKAPTNVYDASSPYWGYALNAPTLQSAYAIQAQTQPGQVAGFLGYVPGQFIEQAVKTYSGNKAAAEAALSVVMPYGFPQ